MKRVLVGLFLVSTLAGASFAVAQTLEEIPFDKRLKLAEVGDEEAQMAVATAYEQGVKPTKKNIVEAARWYREAGWL